MIKVDVSVSNNCIKILKNAFSGQLIDPRAEKSTKVAFKLSAQLLQDSWKNWARGESLNGAEDIKSPNNNLALSIKVLQYGPLDYEIGTNSRYMKRIQEGQRAYDMKDTYPFGHKSRRTKDGRGYLIIPFRWGSNNGKDDPRAHYRHVVPQNIYNIVERYRVTQNLSTTHLEENYSREPVERREYTWGDRLNDEDAGMANGMVRMPHDEGKGEYFTFRVISEKNSMNGDKWWKKAVPPNNVTNALIQSNRETILRTIEKGMMGEFGGEDYN